MPVWEEFSHRLLADWAGLLSSKMDNLLGLGEDKREVVQYGLIVLLSNLLGLIVIFVAAWLLKVLLPTAVVVLTLFLLRPAAGGAHCSSSFRCNLLGFMVLPFLGWAATGLAMLTPVTLLLYQVLALLIVIPAIFIYAPFYTQVKPLVAARKKQLKLRALVLAAALFLLSLLLFLAGHPVWSAAIATGLVWQGLMLLPCGVKLVFFYERLIDLLFKRR